MTREDIEKAAMLRFNIGEPTCGIDKFIEGANWRINSVWHTDLSEVKPCRPILVKFKSGRVGMFEDIRELKGIENMAEAFAYIEDLLPKGKEE